MFLYPSYLGKGVIQCPPKNVFEVIKNPRTRFAYDEMLKVRHEGREENIIIHRTTILNNCRIEIPGNCTYLTSSVYACIQ